MAQQTEHLIRMVNQIALNVAPAHSVEQVGARTADHLRRFWTPAMRARLTEHWRAGGDGLAPAVRRMLEIEDLV